MKRPHLTPRHVEVIRLISLGCNTHEIAAILGVAESTADNTKAAAMRALGTYKSTILTRMAIKYKITTANETLTAAEKRKCRHKDDGWN